MTCDMLVEHPGDTMKTLLLIAALFLSGCACAPEMAAGGATYLALADPVDAVADVVITGLFCDK